MRKSGFSEEQIITILKEHQAGFSVAELCRKHGVSDATFSKWRSKYGGMEVSDAIRLILPLLQANPKMHRHIFAIIDKYL